MKNLLSLVALSLLLSATTGCFQPGAGFDGEGGGGTGLGGLGGINGGGAGGEGSSGIEILEDELGPDGCPTVSLHPEEWAPLSSMYTAGADPFFQIHDNEAGFYFNVELYTVWGDGWTGDTGTYPANCDTHGLCVWLVPDDANPYLATAGDVDVVSLSQTGGALDGPFEVIVRDLTFVPTTDGGDFDCLHVDEVVLRGLGS